MEDIELKKKESNFLDKIKNLFENKKTRYKYLALFVLPFVIAIGVFGFITFKEAKNLISLVSGSEEVNTAHRIESMNYVLRDNATDAQEEYFAELKQAIEIENAPDATIAGLICKNYVADFYTWSNKQGQYDVGGMYYVYDLEKTKENTYLQARDGFYKYLSNYIKQYGANNLLQVENVQVEKAERMDEKYICFVNTHGYTDELGHFYYDADHEYDAWAVKCRWSYKENAKFDSSNYVTSMNFIVVINNGRYEIVEANEKDIELKEYEIESEEPIEEEGTVEE